MPYNYTDQQVTSRASSGGKDAGRKRTADELYAKATQPPHDDDAAAAASLAALSGLAPGVDQDGKPTQGWGTADARNYGKMLYSHIPGSNYTPEYQHAHDGGFSISKLAGGLLKYGAPIAAGLIPGLGPVAAGAIGALGNTAGRAVSGDPFSLKSAILSGVLPAGSQMAGVPYKLFGGGPQAAGAAPIGNMTQGMGGAASAAPSAAPGVASTAASAASRGGILGTGISGADVLKYAPLVTGAIGAYQGAQDMSKAGDLRDRAVRTAEQDYLQRQPYRVKALAQANQPLPGRPDLTPIFQDVGNPFYRPVGR